MIARALAFLLLAVTGFCAQPTVGTIYTDTFSRASIGTDWTNVGATILAVITNSNTMMVTNGGTTWQSVTMNTNLLTMSETWRIECDIVVSNTDFGPAIGLYDTTTSPHGWFAWLELNVSPAPIAIILWETPTIIGAKITGSSTLVRAVGDTIHQVVTRNKNVITCVATNMTLSSTATVSYTINTTSGDLELGPGPSYPAVWAVGKLPAYIDNFKLSEDIEVPVQLLCIGDSITAGLVSSVIGKRWPSLLHRPVTVEAAPGKGINDASNCMAEMLLYKPQRVLFMDMGNDAFGALTNIYKGLVTTFSNAGAAVFHATPTPRTTRDERSFKDWIVATYPSTYFDCWTNLVAPDGHSLTNTMDSSDGTHPGDLGHATTATNIFSPTNGINANRLWQTYHPYWSFF